MLSDEELEAKQRLPMDSLECFARVAEPKINRPFQSDFFSKKFLKLNFETISI